MADAGKIGFTLKNEYDNATPYEYLDVTDMNKMIDIVTSLLKIISEE